MWRRRPYSTFQAGSCFQLGDFAVGSFTIPHDAVDPVGYALIGRGNQSRIVTDLGYVPDSIKIHFGERNLLLLESNHDLGMLKDGPYPWSVKQRVMSRRGHLSNEVVADFIRDDLDGTVTTLILGHLSEHNNHPELVRNSAMDALHGRSLFTQLFVAEPGLQSEVFSLLAAHQTAWHTVLASLFSRLRAKMNIQHDCAATPAPRWAPSGVNRTNTSVGSRWNWPPRRRLLNSARFRRCGGCASAHALSILQRIPGN